MALRAIESMIEAVSPRWALRREVSRSRLALARAYDAARLGPRTAGWRASGAAATTEIGSQIEVLRRRSRDLTQNNPYAVRMATTFQANAIGTGIQPRWDSPQAAELWRQWVDDADADDLTSHYGQQALAARAAFESGEVLGRFVPQKRDAGLAVPMKLRLLEGDFLDTGKTERLSDGGFILFGIEFDAAGQRRAYWLFPEHPGEIASISRARFVSTRVPADHVLHLFRQTRPGQMRGVPDLAPVMLRLRDLDDFEDAEMLKQKIAACFAVFMTQPEGSEAPTTGAARTPTGRRMESIEPGIISYTEPGYTPEFAEPKISTAFEPYTRSKLRSIAVGAGSTYELASGDLSNVNYSSIKAGTNEYRAMVEQWQWMTFIPQFCRPVARAFSAYALASGMRKAPRVIDWTAPKFRMVDPYKEFNAMVLAMKYGLGSHHEQLRELGYDPETVYSELELDRERLAAAGIELPRFEAVRKQKPQAGDDADDKDEKDGKDT